MTTPRFSLPDFPKFPPKLPFLQDSNGEIIEDIQLAAQKAQQASDLIDEANGLFPIPMTNDALVAIGRVHDFLNAELRRRRAGGWHS